MNILTALNKKAKEIFEKCKPQILSDEIEQSIKDIVSRHKPDLK